MFVKELTRSVYVLQGLCVFTCVIFGVTVLGPLVLFCRGLDEESRGLTERLSLLDSYKTHRASLRDRCGEMDEVAVLSRLESLAAQTGVRIDSIEDLAPETEVPGCDWRVVPLNLSFCGEEEAVGRFLASRDKIGFVCRFKDFRIQADARAKDRVRVRLRLEKIDPTPQLYDRDLRGVAFFSENKRPGKDRLLGAGRKRFFKSPVPTAVKDAHLLTGERPDAAQDFSLVGIIDDAGLKAVLEDTKSGKAVFLRKNDMIEGLRVVEIRGREVILEQEGKMSSLVM